MLQYYSESRKVHDKQMGDEADGADKTDATDAHLVKPESALNTNTAALTPVRQTA